MIKLVQSGKPISSIVTSSVAGQPIKIFKSPTSSTADSSQVGDFRFFLLVPHASLSLICARRSQEFVPVMQKNMTLIDTLTVAFYFVLLLLPSLLVFIAINPSCTLINSNFTTDSLSFYKILPFYGIFTS